MTGFVKKAKEICSILSVFLPFCFVIVFGDCYKMEEGYSIVLLPKQWKLPQVKNSFQISIFSS